MAQGPSKTSIQFIINDIQYENTPQSNSYAFNWNFPIKNCNANASAQPNVKLPSFAEIKTMPEPSQSNCNPVNIFPMSPSPNTTQTNSVPNSTCLPLATPHVHKPTITTNCAPSTSSILSRKTPTLPSTSVARTKKSPYYTEAYMNWTFENLRAEHYCKALNEAEADSERYYQCVFSPACDRKMKGKGNLRRHIEWHLRKVEQDMRCRGNVLQPEEYRKLKTDTNLEQQKRNEQQRQRMEQRNTLQKQLHMELQQLVQT